MRKTGSDCRKPPLKAPEDVEINEATVSLAEIGVDAAVAAVYQNWMAFSREKKKQRTALKIFFCRQRVFFAFSTGPGNTLGKHRHRSAGMGQTDGSPICLLSLALRITNPFYWLFTRWIG